VASEATHRSRVDVLLASAAALPFPNRLTRTMGCFVAKLLAMTMKFGFKRVDDNEESRHREERSDAATQEVVELSLRLLGRHASLAMTK
jgi:hypothetical protein